MTEELTIRGLAAATGVSEGTLRMWENRHGFPEPRRLPSGHRRYSDRDVERVRAVVRDRAQGLSLATAVERARRIGDEPRPSVFAALRERFPRLHAHLLAKPVLVALSHAIEDECSVRAARPLLFGCFQRERFYRTEQPRWRELARTADRTVVFADFARTRRPRGAPVEVALAGSDALMREWVLVCDAPAYSACLVASERLSGGGAPRRFEAIWALDPPVVREAARACCALATPAAPDVGRDLHDRLTDTPPSAGEDVYAAVELATRMVLYAAR